MVISKTSSFSLFLINSLISTSTEFLPISVTIPRYIASYVSISTISSAFRFNLLMANSLSESER